MKKSEKVWPLSVAGGTLGAFAALTLAAPVRRPIPTHRHRRRCPYRASSPSPPRPQRAIPRCPPPPPAEVPHLSSPENLPPGTSAVPLDPPQGRGTSYLRDLWHAVQTQDISGKDALLLLTQRPLDPNAVPTNGLPAGPQAPLPDAPAA